MSAQWVDYQEGELAIEGEWTLAHYSQLKAAIAILPVQAGQAHEITLENLRAIDTAGAALLVELLGAERVGDVHAWAPSLPAERQALLARVAQAMSVSLTPKPVSEPWWHAMLALLGQQAEALWHQQLQLMGFTGLVVATFARIFWHPRRWRITAIVAHIQQSGFNAVPIVALLTFMVGAVVAFLGATVLRNFGATIYTIDLVAFSFLREFGVLLAAILLAGRTASAFTAQLGSMKANEEIDALRTQGLDPIELLVLPRVMAMLITLPLLTFVGMLSGLAGGAMVASLSLDIALSQFIGTLERDIAVTHFLLGLSKAPVFAFVIALIGCLEGFKVKGSAQSVGEHTTSSVVQSIFMVILLDALAALFFMEMGW